MASSVEKSNLPMAFLSNERDFPSLIKWIASIPASHLPQDYLSIAVVIQQQIEPIVYSGPQKIDRAQSYVLC